MWRRMELNHRPELCQLHSFRGLGSSRTIVSPVNLAQGGSIGNRPLKVNTTLSRCRADQIELRAEFSLSPSRSPPGSRSPGTFNCLRSHPVVVVIGDCFLTSLFKAVLMPCHA